MSIPILSKRLQALAEEVPTGSVPADIGTDHALLPLYLVGTGRCLRAIAGDVHKGPFETAREAVAEAGFSEVISVRHGDGLAVLQPEEADVLILAGMGATTMIQIFEAQPAVMPGVKRLILQPMIGSGALRRWLGCHNFVVVKEELLEEEGRLYEFLVAEPGHVAKMHEDILFEIGPLLWQKQHPLLARLLDERLEHAHSVATEMGKSKAAVNTQRYRELCGRIAAMEEKRKCL
nr:class I SAM-dependent methyltransferase [uncultured Anaeromusa sp.]